MSEQQKDVAFSYASEQSDYVQEVYDALRDIDPKVSCFFDRRDDADLWGRDLVEVFQTIFEHGARFCVAFISKEWVEKTFPTHERRSALARRLEDDDYLLPVRFDDTAVPGLPSTVKFLRADRHSPSELATLIAKRIGPSHARCFLPPNPNRLYAALRVGQSPDDRLVVRQHARSVLRDLARLDEDERHFIIQLLRLGCPCDLPEELHLLEKRLLRRASIEPDESRRLAESLNGLSGFRVSFGGNHKGDPCILLTWSNLAEGTQLGSATDVPVALVEEAATNRCTACYNDALARLDFSATSSELDALQSACVENELDEVPSSFRPVVDTALERGWSLELTDSQVRLRPPGSLDYVIAWRPVSGDPAEVGELTDAFERDAVVAGLDYDPARLGQPAA